MASLGSQRAMNEYTKLGIESSSTTSSSQLEMTILFEVCTAPRVLCFCAGACHFPLTYCAVRERLDGQSSIIGQVLPSFVSQFCIWCGPYAEAAAEQL